MTELIEELKKEHADIIDLLDRVKELGVISQEGRAILLSAKTRLLAHLQKEDEKLYPVLRREAENNRWLKLNVEIFAADMDTISKTAIDFFEKYSDDDTGLEFFKDSLRLFTTLRGRIGKEERILYAEYDKLFP